ncbi:zf-HC2 domain-containing protein [Nocardia sp. NPDC050710]|uniref:anti-sigma factor family protein n=1 Tax=Nocardia sp. NPDC050710 TaxID=3157220 RepID=UPI003402E4F4
MTDIADDYSTWDAPYVLGSLSRVERREYEDHLAGCGDCQTAVTDLAGLPGMLALVDPDTALAMIEPAPQGAREPEVPPVPQLLPRLADAAERRRKRGRWVTFGAAVAAAAAAVAIAVPLVGSVNITTNEPTTSEQVFAERAMEPLEPTPVSANVKIVTTDGRTRVVMTCRYAPGDYIYTVNYGLVVNGTDGTRMDLGTWPAGPDTVLTVDQTVDMAPDKIANVQIKSMASGKVVLTANV